MPGEYSIIKYTRNKSCSLQLLFCFPLGNNYFSFTNNTNPTKMNWIELIGYLGSFLTSITFIPQVYQAWKTKSVGDLSIWMIFIVNTSTVVWLVYGIGIGSGPVIVANSIVLFLSLLLLYFKLTFKKA